MAVSSKTMLKATVVLSIISLVLSAHSQSFESLQHEHCFIRHLNGEAYVTKITAELNEEGTTGMLARKASTFKIVRGLAALSDPLSISFESIDRPGYYLYENDAHILALAPNNHGFQPYLRRATFKEKLSTVDGTEGVSFHSYYHPDRFIVERKFKLHVASGSGAEFKRARTFKKATPNWS